MPFQSRCWFEVIVNNTGIVGVMIWQVGIIGLLLVVMMTSRLVYITCPPQLYTITRSTYFQQCTSEWVPLRRSQSMPWTCIGKGVAYFPYKVFPLYDIYSIHSNALHLCPMRSDYPSKWSWNLFFGLCCGRFLVINSPYKVGLGILLSPFSQRALPSRLRIIIVLMLLHSNFERTTAIRC